MSETGSGRSLCGVWISPEGLANVAWDDGDGPRETETSPFSPFVWAQEHAVDDLIVGADVATLSGDAPYNRLVRFEDIADYQDFVRQKGRSNAIEVDARQVTTSVRTRVRMRSRRLAAVV